MASRLPLKAHRFIPGFLLDTLRIRRQLSHTDGLMGYALNAQLRSKTFWTFSVWANRDASTRLRRPIRTVASSPGYGRA